MVDFHRLLISLQVAWVPTIIGMKSQCADHFKVVLQELNLPMDYIWKLSVMEIKFFLLYHSTRQHTCN